MVDFFRSIYRLYNKYFLRKPRVKKGLVLLASFLLIWLISYVFIMPPRLEVQIGQMSTNTIIAPFDVLDEVATEKAVQNAIAAVPDAYVRNTNHEDKVIDNLIGIVNYIKHSDEAYPLEVREELSRQFTEGPVVNLMFLSNNSIRYGQEVEEEELNYLLGIAIDVVNKVYDDGIGTIERGHQLILSEIDTYALEYTEAKFIQDILYTVYSPSYVYSSDLTTELRENARNSVRPVIIQKGEILVYEGQVINEQILQMLRTSGFLTSPRRQTMILGLLVFSFVVVLVSSVLLITFSGDIFDKVGQLTLFFLVLVLGYLTSSFLVQFSPYLIAGVAVATILAVLLDWKVAIFGLIAHNILIFPILGDNILPLLSSVIGGLVAVAVSNHMSQRSDMIRIALSASVTKALFLLSWFMLNGSILRSFINDIAIAFLAGIIFVVIAIGSLPFFENTFGIISSVKLLELSNPNRVLLRRLQKEAPGTYNHSMQVANLAEIAADAVGANSLLARVGSYYHDVGKLKRPQFFVENQITDENLHEKYSPSLSALIISSHVKDGVEIAKENKLPDQIVDLIKQHHGEGVVSYFYHKALEEEPSDSEIKKIDFQYEGPKPQTKEAGIIMLADAIEAAVRSMQRRSPAKVEELVHRLVKSKLNDGELDECDLTLKEIDILINAFVKALSGVYHNRIAYPEKSIADLERSRRLGRYTDE